MEDHPDVGHLVAAVIQWIAVLQPTLVVGERTPGYRTSASASIVNGYPDLAVFDHNGIRFCIERHRRQGAHLAQPDFPKMARSRTTGAAMHCRPT